MTTYYTDQHEWIRVEGDEGTVGITRHAAEQLGDVVFVELPQPGHTLKKGEQAAVVESVKAASEVYTPASGNVVDINEELAGEPAKVNGDPQGEGWFFKIKLADAGELSSLMTEDKYQDFVKGV